MKMKVSLNTPLFVAKISKVVFVIALVVLNLRYIGWAAGVAIAALVYDRRQKPAPAAAPVES